MNGAMMGAGEGAGPLRIVTRKQGRGSHGHARTTSGWCGAALWIGDRNRKQRGPGGRRGLAGEGRNNGIGVKSAGTGDRGTGGSNFSPDGKFSFLLTSLLTRPRRPPGPPPRPTGLYTGTPSTGRRPRRVPAPTFILLHRTIAPLPPLDPRFAQLPLKGNIHEH